MKRLIVFAVYFFGILIPTMILVYLTGVHLAWVTAFIIEVALVVSFGLSLDAEKETMEVAITSIIMGIAVGLLAFFVSPHFGWFLVTHVALVPYVVYKEGPPEKGYWSMEASMVAALMERWGFDPEDPDDRAKFWNKLRRK